MINIEIVDDEEILLKKTYNLILTTLNSQDDIQIGTYNSAEDFLSKNEFKTSCDIIFTDIQMKNMNGIQFGSIIRERYPNVYLIFLTSYAEYAADSYALEAYQYIMKPSMDQRLPSVLMKVVEQIKKEKKNYRVIGSVNDIQKLYYKDIIYIRKIKGSKYVEFVTNNHVYRERISLDQLLKEMNAKEFLLAERGYVVNIQCIVRLKSNTIFLKNGDEIIVSRPRFHEVKKEIHRYWERKSG